MTKLNRAAVVALAGVALLAAGALSQRGASSCAGCSAPPQPVVVNPHVVNDYQCTVLELVLDGGVTKDICLTASQLEKVITP